MMTVMPRHATIDEGKFQSEEQLEEARTQPTQGDLAEAKMSEKEAKKQLSDRIVELESVVEWKLNATREGKGNMGDRVDLPTKENE
jgi:hypothetical protein